MPQELTVAAAPRFVRCEALPEMANTVVTPKTKVKTKTERPRLHKVILLNDDYTRNRRTR